jgi:hypothetical protein
MGFASLSCALKLGRGAAAMSSLQCWEYQDGTVTLSSASFSPG